MIIMQTKVIGFVGKEQFDIMHYLSRVLACYPRKVLMVDLSCERILEKSISIPEIQKNGVIEYRGVDFTTSYDNQIVANYDVVMIDFGNNVEDQLISECELVFLITDLLDNSIKTLNKVSIKKDENPILIVRDVVKNKITPTYLANLLKPELSPICIYTIYHDEGDYQTKLNCYYDSIFKFKRLSGDFKDLLMSILEMIDLKMEIANPKLLKKAYKLAERGK